jgi:hypothetical protein
MGGGIYYLHTPWALVAGNYGGIGASPFAISTPIQYQQLCQLAPSHILIILYVTQINLSDQQPFPHNTMAAVITRFYIDLIKSSVSVAVHVITM